jgi:hypothetical protein
MVIGYDTAEKHPGMSRILGFDHTSGEGMMVKMMIPVGWMVIRLRTTL